MSCQWARYDKEMKEFKASGTFSTTSDVVDMDIDENEIDDGKEEDNDNADESDDASENADSS